MVWVMDEPEVIGTDIVPYGKSIRTVHTHPDVDIIWNFWPLNVIIWIPIGEILNALIWPITLFTWPLWWIWNTLTLLPMVIGLPIWLFVTFAAFVV